LARNAPSGFLQRVDDPRHIDFIRLRKRPAGAERGGNISKASKMGAPRHRAPKLFSSSSTRSRNASLAPGRREGLVMEVMVFGVLFFRPCCFTIVSIHFLAARPAGIFPTLVECKNIRRPTHVFTLKNPGASTFSI